MIIKEVIEDYEKGKRSVLDTLLLLENAKEKLNKAMDTIKKFKEDNLEKISSEASEHKEGYKGYKIEYRSGGKIYDFKNIPEWQNAEKKKKEIESKYRSMFEAKQKGLSFANISDDGEEMIMPKISYRKSSIVIKEIK